MRERGSEGEGRARLTFWPIQIAGWAAFMVAMVFSRIGIYPLGQMFVRKGALALIGLGVTAAMRPIYRRLATRSPGWPKTIIWCVVGAYVASLVWTPISNAVDHWILIEFYGAPARAPRPSYYVSGAVYYAFALLAWSLLYFGAKHMEALQIERDRSLRAEALADRARLQALRYQLNPHFLFNTLNAVSTLVVEKKNAEAGRMLSLLSDFLRSTIENPDVHEVPLAAEIERTLRYLEIEQVRFGDRLRVKMNIADGLSQVRVPTLLLQPLVENAVRHAIAPRTDGGSVAIDVSRDDGMLRVAVTDDGPGFKPTSYPGGHGVGLANTRERLERLYGKRHRMNVGASASGGASVIVHLPLAPADVEP